MCERSVTRLRRRVAWCGVCLAAAAGCSQRLEPIFQSPQPAPHWPAEPAQARIRYLGQLKTSADLKAPPDPWKTLGSWLVGPEPPHPLYGPRTAVCTPDGRRLWVADPGGRCLHLFDLDRRRYKKLTRLGNAQLFSPVALGLGPEGSLYVCDSENVGIHRIRDDDGRWLETLRLPQDVQRPVAIAYDPTRKELFVVDVLAHDIKVLSAGDASLIELIGRRGTEPGAFNFPSAILLDGDSLWVVDSGNYRIQGLHRSGDPFATFGQAGDAPGDLALPKGVACDSTGNLYVVDARFENVQIFDRQGRLLLVFGEEGTKPGEFWLPGGIFIDALDRIWVCDTYNRRVQVFEPVPVRPEGDQP